jgi:hypothetical protein
MSRLPRTAGRVVLAAFAVAGFALPAIAGSDAPPPPPPIAPLPPAGAPSTAPDAAGLLTAAQLKELVGPVALYPDVILASLLPATTEPLDVIAAARYVEEQGGKVSAVPATAPWAESVKAMLQYPEALAWMADNVDWLRQMGQAVALQQPDVLNAIQAFRAEAEKAGNLKSDEHMAVTAEPAPTGAPIERVIVIEPAAPSVVYVPVYDPWLVCAPYYGPEPLFHYHGFSGFSAWGPWCYTSICWGWWPTHAHWAPSICSFPTVSYWHTAHRHRLYDRRWSARSGFYGGFYASRTRTGGPGYTGFGARRLASTESVSRPSRFGSQVRQPRTRNAAAQDGFYGASARGGAHGDARVRSEPNDRQGRVDGFRAPRVSLNDGTANGRIAPRNGAHDGGFRRDPAAQAPTHQAPSYDVPGRQPQPRFEGGRERQPQPPRVDDRSREWRQPSGQDGLPRRDPTPRAPQHQDPGVRRGQEFQAPPRRESAPRNVGQGPIRSPQHQGHSQGPSLRRSQRSEEPQPPKAPPQRRNDGGSNRQRQR